MKTTTKALYVAALLLTCFAARAMEQQMSFKHVVESSAAIFLGTVTEMTARESPNGNMIFTDVHFAATEVIYSAPSYKLGSPNKVILSFAGGEKGDRKIVVSGVPHFDVGGRYVVCVGSEDPYVANPIRGGTQGLFPVVSDKDTADSYPLTYSRRAIVGLDSEGHLEVSPPVDSFSQGKAMPKQAPATDLRFMTAPATSPASPSPNAVACVGE